MMVEDNRKKIRVAVIGGGCGALTAAFHLSQGKRANRYEITIYQMGWRLGGKGASGRNKAEHNRTEEHGLHVWMGFYENAFRLIRSCYDELPKSNRQSPFGSWDEAFIADHWVGVADESRGVWRTWNSFFPATPGLPGDPIDSETNPFALRGYMARACDLLRALIHSGYSGSAEKLSDPNDLASVTPETIVDKITSILRTGVLTGASALYEAMTVLQVVLSGRFSLPGGDYLVLRYADAVAKNLKAQAESLFDNDKDLGPKLELVELVVTVIVGILRDQLLSDPDGLDAINDEDCVAWLKRHGASARATSSPIVRALYDMAFANVKTSRHDTPGLAAGQALRGALRLFFTYRGSFFWKMRAGMGDAVFSPLYEVLKQRGVKFEFFHELVDIRTKAVEGSRRVTALHFLKQAQVKPRSSVANLNALAARAVKDREYYPLDDDGCWPSKADASQLERVAAGVVNFEAPCSKELIADDDLIELTSDQFDCVVLGASVGALESACPDLLKHDARWRSMVQNLKTVPTQTLQLWLYEGLDTLCPTPTPITVSGFKKPFDTWSDMTHVIAQETWEKDLENPKPRPKALIYLCGGLPYVWDDERPLDRDEALAQAVDHLDRDLPLLLPKLADKDRRAFRWALLEPNPPAFDAKQSWLKFDDKKERIASQYFAINTNPSDGYVLTRPGTMQYRISPLDSGYENMTIAGDWTDCGFNEGCVEAAVMSGLLASHAVCRSPRLEDIVGFDHP
jgi:uncharacterized protein with NAD-binding domain and iron-sulfur cluster